MQKKTIYTCEKCGLEIENDHQAMLDHEYGHVEPELQRPQTGNYDPTKTYPQTIIIKMSNGATVEYSTPREIESPLEKESPSETD